MRLCGDCLDLLRVLEISVYGWGLGYGFHERYGPRHFRYAFYFHISSSRDASHCTGRRLVLD